MTSMDALMRSSPVIPVLTVHDALIARPLAEALVAGGLRTLEVTLRTPAALDAIRQMSRVDGAIVGAGTVLNGRDLDACVRSGARFVVSPGLTETLARQALARGIPFLPGVATASDIIRGLELGFDRFKFFPAEAAGGVNALKALAAPFSQCRFCPTGGITQASAATWLGLEAVLCVGGSWLVPERFDADEVFERAKAAAALRAQHCA
ncbi:bifunctional 4-hydroxy-2-oxoglutarate aldolase/2-dehydro-3-deoxy-phosphogluconate aldolase [Sinimarinibacterium thermocellulolyticum]|uniref:2-dehydro-3-deoxy-phosphogluconate aldolase n=1 Tax=Sinimarinibacterium thermocellulolyticum TaxID=3170016 RepID=A0ABV2A8P2_9GAMM